MKFEEIKEKIQYGDFNTLKEVLNAKSSNAARMRFNRKDPEAVEAMKFIHENRKTLPEIFKRKNETTK